MALPIRTKEENAHPIIGTIDDRGQSFVVTCRVVFDGVEYVGRLWFAPIDGNEGAIPDRSAIGGRTREEVISLAARLTPYELTVRHRRATAEKRRYLSLRRATDEILSKIRYMNQVTLSMRAGLIDSEGAAQEIDLTERQILDSVRRLKEEAGIED